MDTSHAIIKSVVTNEKTKQILVRAISSVGRASDF